MKNFQNLSQKLLLFKKILTKVILKWKIKVTKLCTPNVHWPNPLRSMLHKYLKLNMSSFFNLQILNKKKLSHRFQKIWPPFRYQKFTEHKTCMTCWISNEFWKSILKLALVFVKLLTKIMLKLKKWNQTEYVKLAFSTACLLWPKRLYNFN